MTRSALLLVCISLAACGLPTVEPRVTVTLESPLLSANTEATWFSLGHTRDFQPWGTAGEIKASPHVASADFRLVPEGDWLADFSGYGRLHFVAPDPPSFPTWAWCLTERASAALRITSGQRSLLVADALPVGPCARVAASRYLLDSDYTAAPTQPTFGSADGGNIAWLYLDDQGATAALQVSVDTSVSPSPLGLFAALPDTGAGQTWPAVSSWNVTTLALSADADGNARVALVVKPGSLPAAREVVVRRGRRASRTGCTWWARAAAAARRRQTATTGWRAPPTAATPTALARTCPTTRRAATATTAPPTAVWRAPAAPRRRRPTAPCVVATAV